MYKVSDLTDKLGVARSTINDWLKNYDQFIDYSMQGKRKVYSERTLKVLEEISELRNSGLSSHEICEELEKRHPLNGEVHQQQEVKEKATKNEESTSKVTTPALFNSESLALMNQEQTEQLVAIINDRLQSVNTLNNNLNNRLDNIDERLNDIDLMDKVEVKKSSAAPYFFLLLLIIGAIGVLAFFAIKKFDKLNDERVALEKKNSQLNTNTENLSNQVSTFDAQLKKQEQVNADHKAKYERDLAKQRKEFAVQIASLKAEAKRTNDISKAYEAQILELKNELAAQQKELTKKIIEASKASQQTAQATEKNNKIIAEQNKINNDLTDKINSLVEKLAELKNTKKTTDNKQVKENSTPVKITANTDKK
ncbi:MerR family transcriptional regulator [Lentisphaerota bacterium WC36G]|nr:MerR family transcriptional regulator [Lentisphaerae bacterium WC36]